MPNDDVRGHKRRRLDTIRPLLVYREALLRQISDVGDSIPYFPNIERSLGANVPQGSLMSFMEYIQLLQAFIERL